MRVLRVYHAGRNPAHLGRERALQARGVELTLVVPGLWPAPDGQIDPPAEPFQILERPVTRVGDVNRHRYTDRRALRQLVDEVEPDVLDIHEEPFSVAASQWIAVAPPAVPIVMYTAQNIDKRFPPPFAPYERRALRRVSGLYPCSRQAASVARGKGFR